MPMSGAAAFDFTVTSDDASRATRSPTLRLAFLPVGVHTPRVQVTFLVPALEIVIAACAPLASVQAIATATVTNFAMSWRTTYLLMITAVAGWRAGRANRC